MSIQSTHQYNESKKERNLTMKRFKTISILAVMLILIFAVCIPLFAADTSGSTTAGNTNLSRIFDIAATIAAACGFIWGLIKSRFQLSGKTQAAIKLLTDNGITLDAIENILYEASAFSKMTNSEKQTYAAEEIRKAAARSGITVKDAALNDIVTWLWARLK